MVLAFNKIDDLLRDPHHEAELLSYKSRPRGEDGASPARGSTGAIAQVQDRLQAAIAMDMARARERGTLSTEDALRIMKGTAMLQRLEQASSLAADGGESSGPPPGAAAFGVGCTAVCVVVTATHLICANAGDSRAVLSRGGQAVRCRGTTSPTTRVSEGASRRPAPR
eukprot:SRR837773.20424.p2 GENE.SRR837773.20424~~SRR837773.20424.p2  ORF type:complete len:177 (+),score=48.99 SRR837773.20424:29-532(+)